MEDIKSYLDNLVRINEEANKTHELNKNIRASLNAGDVLVYDGIKELADAAGEELIEEPRHGTRCNYRYYFIYKGVTFESFEIERLKETSSNV